MSATEIMAELPKLSRPELEAVGARLHELLRGDGLAVGRHWGQALGEFAGTVQELPADYAANHDRGFLLKSPP